MSLLSKLKACGVCLLFGHDWIDSGRKNGPPNGVKVCTRCPRVDYGNGRKGWR